MFPSAQASDGSTSDLASGRAMPGWALLRWEIGGLAELGRTVPDRPGDFGERGGNAQGWAGVDSVFVVAAAQILQQGVAGDHGLRCPFSL